MRHLDALRPLRATRLMRTACTRSFTTGKQAIDVDAVGKQLHLRVYTKIAEADVANDDPVRLCLDITNAEETTAFLGIGWRQTSRRPGGGSALSTHRLTDLVLSSGAGGVARGPAGRVSRAALTSLGATAGERAGRIRSGPRARRRR
jgi:hypothetical protein